MIATLNDFSLPLPASEPLMPTMKVEVTEELVMDHSSLVTRPSSFTFAFTLLEVCIAMTIGILILGVAVMSVTGLQGEQQLKEVASSIESTARNSLLKAIAEHRPIQLALAGGIGGADGNVEVKRYGEPSFRKATRDEMWEFDPTGVCEPIELRITSANGTIELGFDPLTACARKKNISVNG
jgi:type II secretory pathway pseudopilin PulG